MISREELIQKLRAEAMFYSETDMPYYRELFKEAADAIEALSQPERPKGRWEECKYSRNLGQCSLCGEIVEIRSKFCPNCGADMRGEEE